MKTTIKQLAIALGIFVMATAANAQNTVMVGGEAMYPKKDIVDNAVPDW